VSLGFRIVITLSPEGKGVAALSGVTGSMYRLEASCSCAVPTVIYDYFAKVGNKNKTIFSAGISVRMFLIAVSIWHVRMLGVF